MASTDGDYPNPNYLLDSRWRLKLLVDLANVRDAGGVRKFQRSKERELLRHLPEEDLLMLRDDIRKIWDHDVAMDEKDKIIADWLHPGPLRELNPFLSKFKYGRLSPNPQNIRVMLAVAILDVAQLGYNNARSPVAFFGYCENPRCGEKYFIRNRRTDIYCGSEDCETFGNTKRQGAWRKRKAKKKQSNKKG